jgi:hypothetical protein
MEPSTRNKKIWLAGLCLLLIIWGLTDVRKRAHFDPVRALEDPILVSKHRTDVTVYTEAGAAFFDGRDPYEVTSPRGWMYLYPPLFAILISPLHHLPPQWQGVTWYFFSLAMVWGCYRETARLIRYARVEEWIGNGDSRKKLRWVQVGTVVAVLIPTLNCLQRGQVGILILYLLLLGFRLVLERDSWQRTVAGGMVLSLAIVFKVIPALPVFFLLFLLMARSIKKTESADYPSRFLEAGAGVISGLILFFWVVPSIFVGWQANAKHLNTWTRLIGDQAVETSREAHFSNPNSIRNQSLSNALYHVGNRVAYWFSLDTEPQPWLHSNNHNRFMNSPAATKAVLAVRVVLVLMLIPVGWRMAARGDPLDTLAALGMACMAMLVASPVSRGHYFMLQWPAIVFGSLWVWRHISPQKAVLCAAVPSLLSLVHYILITAGPRGIWGVSPIFLGTLGMGTALWYVVMAYALVTTSVPKTKMNA